MWDVCCVVSGSWGLDARCLYTELIEMDDSATEPACKELRLDMWNICWRSTTSSRLNHEEAEHFQPVRLVVAGKGGKVVKVKDVLEGMVRSLEVVRGRLDSEGWDHRRTWSSRSGTCTAQPRADAWLSKMNGI